MLRRSRLEAVLLLAREPLAPRKLAQSANLTDGTEARTLLTELRRCYDARGCAFGIEQLAGGYQLMTRPKFAPWLRPLVPAEQEIRLSPPALETLAVVAYRQPVLRAEVEAIRGVACGEILRQLMERDLLRIVGRSEELGRPLWYGTTKRFLYVFGLSNLDGLPLAADLRRPIAAQENSESRTGNLSSTNASAKPVAENWASVAENTEPVAEKNNAA
jgi:segregation and condensation protein B